MLKVPGRADNKEENLLVVRVLSLWGCVGKVRGKS